MRAGVPRMPGWSRSGARDGVHGQGVRGTLFEGTGEHRVKVQHLRGVGDTAVAYLTTTKTRSVATCPLARNGTFVFLLVGSPNAGHLMQEAIALAQKAASRT
jgi:hypothetical protein